MLTIEHCYRYIRSLHDHDTCGIRGNPAETLIARVARFKGYTGCYYHGNGMMSTPDGYRHLPLSVIHIAEQFEQCTANDFAAYDVDEMALTRGAYLRLPCGDWFSAYYQRDAAKAYSPDIYNRYYARKRIKSLRKTV